MDRTSPRRDTSAAPRGYHHDRRRVASTRAPRPRFALLGSSMAWHVLSAALLFPTAGLGDNYQPSNTAQSFPTLEQAEAALRAAYPGAADLTFERILSETPTHSVRLYALPTVAPNPPVWLNCNVPGDYTAGQALCDAALAQGDYPYDDIRYLDFNPEGTDGGGEGSRGGCFFMNPSPPWPPGAGILLFHTQRMRTCPGSHPFLKNYVRVMACGGGPPTHGSGPDLACGKSLVLLTETITVTRTSCPIQPLPPITDPTVLLFENNPKRSDTTCLAPAMSTALSCLLTAATNAGGTPSVGSACRPAAYNQHLIDVWKKWREELKPEHSAACAALRSEVKAHFNRHGLLESQSPVLNSKHITGGAVDVTIDLPATQIDTLAASCQLRRPLPVSDRVHFIHR